MFSCREYRDGKNVLEREKRRIVVCLPYFMCCVYIYIIIYLYDLIFIKYISYS